MIYGALEVFSFKAVEQWVWRGHLCEAPANFGEDKYMTNCMDFLGVMRVRDDTVLGDKLCHSFTSCDNPQNAAFHPFKDVTSWMQCCTAPVPVHWNPCSIVLNRCRAAEGCRSVYR